MMYPLQDHHHHHMAGVHHGFDTTGLPGMKGEPLLGAPSAVRAWIQQPQDLASIAQGYGRYVCD